MAMCYQGKSCLFHTQTIRNWLCGTKPNHIFAVVGTCKVGFADQTKPYLSCRQNVRSWICGTRPNHVCAVGEMLEVGFIVLNQIIFVPQTECLKLALRTKPNHIVTVDRMLDDGFVTKASSLKPRPTIVHLEPQMNDRNVSWVDKKTMHSFMSPKFTRGLGLVDA